jgi:hypothetical protein
VNNATTSTQIAHFNTTVEVAQESASLHDQVVARDILFINTTSGGFSILGNAHQSSSQLFHFQDAAGNCFLRVVDAVNNTATTERTICNSLSPEINPYLPWK